MSTESIETMLTGGHPNSLGQTVRVVEILLSNPDKLEELYQCYASSDESVRLRTSNAFKRIWRAQPSWLIPYIDRFLAEVSQIQQASAQWTLTQLVHELDMHLTSEQRQRAIIILKENLKTATDWILINNTVETLGTWAQTDAELREWLLPHLERVAQDRRKSVVDKANLWHDTLSSIEQQG